MSQCPHELARRRLRNRRIGTFFAKPEARKQLALDLRDYADVYQGLITIAAVQRVHEGLSYDAACARFMRLRHFLEWTRVPFEWRSAKQPGVERTEVSALVVRREDLLDLADRLTRDYPEGQCWACGKARAMKPSDRRGARERMPKKRRSDRFKITIYGGNHRGSVFAELGWYEDGRLGEVWLTGMKALGSRDGSLEHGYEVDVATGIGSQVEGVLNTFARTVSYMIQLGCPVREVSRLLGDADGVLPGKVDSEDCPAIHGREFRSVFAAVAALIAAETDDEGRRKA